MDLSLSNDQVILILLYTYAAGTALNGICLFASVMFPKKLLKSRIDRITFGLLLVSFLWSLGRVAIESMQARHVLAQSDTCSAGFSNLCIVLIFFLNGSLAMERYFQIKGHPLGKELFTALYLVMAGFLAIVVFAFSTSTSLTGAGPDSSLQMNLWIGELMLTFFGILLIMIWCYTRTFRYSARQFRENPTMLTFFMKQGEEWDDSENLELIRLRVGEDTLQTRVLVITWPELHGFYSERQILVKCVLLSASLVICYLPLFSWCLLFAYHNGNPLIFDPDMQFFFIGVIFLAVDMVVSCFREAGQQGITFEFQVTPVLVLYFKKEMREALPMFILTVDQVIMILLYVYGLATLLNGVCLVASAVFPKTLLKSRMDRITFALLLVSFIWSLGRVVIETMQGVDNLGQDDPTSAGFSNLCLVVIFIFNGSLAMERYFQIREHPYARQWFTLLYSVMFVFLGIVCYAFSTSTSRFGVGPDFALQRTMWISVIITTFVGILLVMIWCYVRTFRYSARQFRENPMMLTFFMKEGDERNNNMETLELIRLRVERTILIKCVLLSISLVICYLPLFIWSVLFVANNGNAAVYDPQGQFFFAGAIMLAVDMVVTPMLVLYFKKEMRETLYFWNPMFVLTFDQVIMIKLYVYGLATLLNGVCLAASALFPKKLLKSRMDRITFALLLVSFIWSLGRVVIETMQGVGNLAHSDPTSAAFSNLCLVLIFFFNGSLAMERYFQIREHPYARQLFTALYSVMFVFLGIVCYAFSTSPSNGVGPEYTLQQTMWISEIIATFVGTVLIMIWCYVRTFRYSARQFRENPMMLTFFMKEGDERNNNMETLELIRLRVGTIWECD
ncbi:hypothetical protein HDU98_005776 [Podochytrium sp. JEL0797]|nr:hypothetical protein HDU98_005776 [Podochytrium sp. JEL0797]